MKLTDINKTWALQTVSFLLASLVIVCAAARPSAAAEAAVEAGVDVHTLTETMTGSRPRPPALTLEAIRTAAFSDVAAEAPHADYISYAVHQGMMTGREDGSFAPEAFVTRGELMEILFVMSGDEAPQGESAAVTTETEELKITEVVPPAITWAVEQGITTSGANFNAGALVNRAHLATFLQRYAALKGYDTESTGDLSRYTDGGRVSPAFIPSVSWALEHRLFAAMVSDTIHPELAVSRVQLAQILVALTAHGTYEKLAVDLAAQLSCTDIPSASRANHEALQAAVDAAAKKYGAIGLQVAVIEDGEVSDTYSYGWATKDTTPMTADHKIRIASISKVAVGMAAMSLEAEDIVELDTGIEAYWGGGTIRNPAYPDIPITIRSLLNHTSSIVCYGDDVSRDYAAVKAKLYNGGFSRTTPGIIGSFNYNNYAYGVLGMTLELAAGQVMDDILGQRIWTPLGIDAAFESGEINRTDLLVTHYRHDGSVSRTADKSRSLLVNPTPGSKGTYFAGGLTTSASDMAKMVCVLANDGTYEGLRVMEAESIATMETCDPKMPLGTYYQGLPLRYQANLYGRDGLYYHTGSAYGVYNCMSYDPVSRDGVVVLTVGASAAKDSAGIYAVCGEISRAVYDATNRGVPNA